jgi:hypothetical protein
MEQSQQAIYREAWEQRGGDRMFPSCTLGAYADDFTAMALEVFPGQSFLVSDEPHEVWRKKAHATLTRLLGRTPARPKLKVESDGVTEYNQVRIEKLRWQLPYGPATEALFLTPSKYSGKLPGVVALHDHGGFKYYGKENIADQPDDATRPALQAFRDNGYGGHAWATMLAKRGYAVLVHDVFPWGSRRIRIEDLPAHLQQPFANYKPNSEEYVKAYNAWTGPVETEIFKSLSCSGSTFMGIVNYEDLCAVDYLVSRQEVDPNRIGCGGLSGGGLRSLWLSGMDDRIACSFVAGFMPTVRGLSAGRLFTAHTMMAYVTGMAETLDFPDVLSVHAPKPTFVLQCTQDELFTLSSMKAAEAILGGIYSKLGKLENFKCGFYPHKHMFTPPMQDDAFGFFDKWLK